MSRKNHHAVALGRKGGMVKSKKKSASARRNGKKGGRPRKPQSLPLAETKFAQDKEVN